MLILELALAAILTTKDAAPEPPPPVVPQVTVILGGDELARAIKQDLERIAGPGSVEVSIDHETLFSVRIAVSSLGPAIYTRIYDRAVDLYRHYPDLNFDFYLRSRTQH